MESSGMPQSGSEMSELRDEVQRLRKEFEVQAATMAGTQATQAATQAGAQATQGAVQAGQMSTFTASQAGMMTTVAAGSVGFIVGIFLGISLAKA